MKVIKIGLILVVGLFILFVGIGTFYEPSAESLRKEKEGCSRALMSSIEAPVRTYADKAAYDAAEAAPLQSNTHLQDKCAPTNRRKVRKSISS